jgi:hypothetical protein
MKRDIPLSEVPFGMCTWTVKRLWSMSGVGSPGIRRENPMDTSRKNEVAAITRSL